MRSSLGSRFSKFSRGFTLPLRALETIFNHPHLILLSLIPVLLSALFVGAVIYAGLAGAWAAGMNGFQNWAGEYSWVFSGILVFFVAGILLYFLFHTLSLLVSLIASPFNDWLANSTERALGTLVPPLHFLDLIRVFFLDLRKTLLALFLISALSLWSLVPGFGLLSIFGFAFVHALTFVTYAQNRRKHGVSQSIHWLFLHWESSLGFGLATFCLFSIPVIDLFAIPLSVVGGTLLFLENEKSGP